jgi:predicted ABC-type ATPase
LALAGLGSRLLRHIRLASCGGRAEPGILGGVTRLDVPGSGDQPLPGRPVADSLLARLADLASNHPSSPRYARSEQPQLREAATGDGGEAEVSADARPVPREGKPRPRDNADAGPSGPTDAVRTGEEVASADQPSIESGDFAEHIEMLTTQLSDAKKRGLDTDRLYTDPPDHKSWTTERLAAQMEIIEDLYRDGRDVPCHGEAVLAGGLGGAGKGTVLAKYAGIDTSKYLVIDPDRIKEQMAERGMIPKVEELSPMECSVLVHEESSWIAANLAKRAYAEGRNVIWDVTMSSLESTERRINDLRTAGYHDLAGVFVDIPAEQSVQRALERYRAGMERYGNGVGQGGRYVPPAVILAQRTADGQTVNRQVFETVKPRFDRWVVFDNSRDGERPALTDSSEWEKQ